MILKYEGTRGSYILGIPSRDLNEDDLKTIIAEFPFADKADAIANLTKHGLYSVVKPKTKAAPKPKMTTKDDS